MIIKVIKKHLKGAMRVSSPGALPGEMINCLLDGTDVISL